MLSVSTKTNGVCWGGVLAESDSESAPSWTPTKVLKEKDSLHVKTLEEIRLEKIQAESAAYWEGIAGGPMAWEAANPAANPSANPCGTILGPRKPCNSSTSSFKKSNIHVKNVTKELDFRVLTLDEIRRNRARKTDSRSNGLPKEQQNHNFSLRPQSNGYAHEQVSDVKSHLGISDLRSKLKNNAKTLNEPDMTNHGDTCSSKRQRQDTSPQSGSSKKQRIRLCRMNDMTGEKTSESYKYVEKFGDGVDGNIIGDIDKLLME